MQICFGFSNYSVAVGKVAQKVNNLLVRAKKELIAQFHKKSEELRSLIYFFQSISVQIIRKATSLRG